MVEVQFFEEGLNPSGALHRLIQIKPQLGYIFGPQCGPHMVSDFLSAANELLEYLLLGGTGIEEAQVNLCNAEVLCDIYVGHGEHAGREYRNLVEKYLTQDTLNFLGHP